VTSGVRPQGASQILSWYDFVSKNFMYRFNWALGSIIALAINDAHGGELRPTSLDEWPETGLPWAVFWLKELITWGTLDPVAAFLLSQRVELLRINAEERARLYYEQTELAERSPDDRLRASSVRDWVLSLAVRTPSDVSHLVGAGPPVSTNARL